MRINTLPGIMKPQPQTLSRLFFPVRRPVKFIKYPPGGGFRHSNAIVFYTQQHLFVGIAVVETVIILGELLLYFMPLSMIFCSMVVK